MPQKHPVFRYSKRIAWLDLWRHIGMFVWTALCSRNSGNLQSASFLALLAAGTNGTGFIDGENDCPQRSSGSA